jgi:Cu(I)/Ag(I) efflux system membrane fusion protein
MTSVWFAPTSSCWVRLAALLLGLAASSCGRAEQMPEPDPHAGHSSPAPASSSPPGDLPSAAAENHPAGHGTSGSTPSEGPPPGYAAFTLDADRARAVGLRLAPVEHRDFSRQVRTTGAVVLDETRTSHVHAKVRGWIENVNVDFVGKSVAAGAPLCSIYSQEVLAAELEFLSILEQTSNAAPPSGAFGDAEKRARDQLLSAARRRLALWDVPAAEIARLEATREPRRAFTLDAPRAGIVVAKQALPGLFIDPSVELYVISDVRKLWVLADVYESDLPGVKLGARAALTIEGSNGASVPAEVAFLPPTVDEATRTLKVRFNLDNPDGAIRPGAFATVELRVELGQSLAVPEAAVIHAGRQAIVFVVSGERIEPRNVQLGPLVDGYYAAEAGLSHGESVAVGAQFLIDSESRLRATSGSGAGHSHGSH